MKIPVALASILLLAVFVQGQNEIVSSMNARLDALNQQIGALASSSQAVSDLNKRIVTLDQTATELQNSQKGIEDVSERIHTLTQQISNVEQSFQNVQQLVPEVSAISENVTGLQSFVQNQTRLEGKITSLNQDIHAFQDNLYEQYYISEILFNMTNEADELEKSASKISRLREINLRSLVWPQGRYSLLMPRAGCPMDDLIIWGKGSRTHWTTSSGDNQNENSTGNHMPPDLFTVENGNYLARLHFCTHRVDGPGVVGWPEGTFCINRKNSVCPEGFDRGDLTFDDEDRNGRPSVNRQEGIDPDGTYDDDTRYRFCCIDNGDHDTPMLLPNDEPFYLYRYKGRCQEVFGMNVYNDYIVVDTANDDPANNKVNGDRQGHVVPDGTINNIRLELCYYEPITNDFE